MGHLHRTSSPQRSFERRRTALEARTGSGDVTGARRSEVASLKVSDIDSQRMVVHIHGGKGRKDRDVMLSPALLEALRSYWRGLRHKPGEWLFAGNRCHTSSRPITTKVLWLACRQAAVRAGLEHKLVRMGASLRFDPIVTADWIRSRSA